MKTQNTPLQIDTDEWLYKGCFIQRCDDPRLSFKFTVFKNNMEQTHVDRCHTFVEAKKLCRENECEDNYLTF